MKIEMDVVQEMTLEEFAEQHDLVMVVRERKHLFLNDPARFYASFKGVEVMINGCLGGEFGDGKTPEEAIANYVPRISRKRIAVNALEDDRREIEVPTLTGVK